MKTFNTPTSLEAATREVKQAKLAIESKKIELESVKANGFTHHGELDLGGCESLTEIISAVSDVMNKFGGDMAIEWVGDVAEYSYKASEADVKRFISSIENRITELQERIDYLMSYISETMEQIKIDIDMKNYMNA